MGCRVAVVGVLVEIKKKIYKHTRSIGWCALSNFSISWSVGLLVVIELCGGGGDAVILLTLLN